MTSSAPRRWPSTERSLRTTGRRLPTLARLIELAKRWDEPSRLAYVGLVAIGAYVMALGWAMEHRDYDEWGAFAVFPVLVTVSLPILWRITRDDERPIPGILGFGVVAKLLASLARYYVVFAVYEGNADASTYHEAGIQIRHSFHSGAISIFGLIPHAEGTDFLKQLTGLLYTVMGPTVLGGFLVFSWMGFWGLIFTYRAVLIAFPEADSRRYAKFLFFLPSLLFWPSSLGKESWLMFTLGITFYGAAGLLTARRSGLPLTLLGCALTAMVRPHVAAVAIVSLAIAFIFRSSHTGDDVRKTEGASARKLIIVGILIIGVAVAISQSARFLGSRGNINEVLNSVSKQTNIGGSAIHSEHPNSILQFPQAVFAVLFRPTLLEAHNATNLIAAMETTTLLVFFVSSAKRIRTCPAWLFRRPFVLFCVTYSAIFSFAWSSIGNLGILVRQRTLAWPAVLILLALPTSRPKRRQTQGLLRAGALEVAASPVKVDPAANVASRTVATAFHITAASKRDAQSARAAVPIRALSTSSSINDAIADRSAPGSPGATTRHVSSGDR